MPENLENSAVATGLEKVSFHFNPKKGSAKECSNYCTIALISHASRVMLKILQVRLQQYVNQELPDVQAVFQKGKKKKKAEEPELKLPIPEKAREFQKNISSYFINYTRGFDCLDHNQLWKILKEVEYQTTLPAS